ncbi:DsbA family protein [Granulicella tundricola]|uniref:DsbA family protein n=1 Tax=Granulicella tundricola TaxID=940615 RepID=UPI0038CBF622
MPPDPAAAQAIIQAAATQADLNPEAFHRALADPTLTSDIESDHLEGARRGIRGVPALSLNEKRVDGIQSLDLYQKYLAQEQANLQISN